MEIKQIHHSDALIRFSTAELLILNNALNEVCNALDVTEFSTRMGAELKDVRNLLRQIGKVLDAQEQQLKKNKTAK
ncbi:MAG: hypothetical protein D6732_29015 [Methanobacteriota archaeon]|nr:MAG: hypothetical protein D6732_29015 [Euryarchaeota archaeon]